MKYGIAVAVSCLGLVMLAQGEHKAARQLLAEGLALSHDLGVKRDLARNLVGWASLAFAEGQLRKAAKLLGAIAGWLVAMGAQLDEPEHSVQNGTIAALHARLDDTTFKAAWAEGSALTLEQVIAYALSSSASE